MVDNLSILLLCGAIVLVAWQAIRLDAAQPWITRRRDAPARPRRPGGRMPRR